MPPPAPPLGAPAPQPQVRLARSSKGTPLWPLLLIAGLAVLLLVAAWFFLVRPQDDAGVFVGSWTPVQGTGGGLVIKQDGDVTISVYDPQLSEAAASAASVDGDSLTTDELDLSSLGLEGAGAPASAVLTHDADRDILVVELDGDEARAYEFARTDVLQRAPDQQTPAPPPSTPTPTATPTPTGSPAATADQVVIAGINKIQIGVMQWAANSNGVYPAESEVSATGGVAQYVDPWPVDPYTNQPMTAGTAPGSYTYEQLDGGTAFSLTGYLGNNLSYTVP
jgi:hypothetical protein